MNAANVTTIVMSEPQKLYVSVTTKLQLHTVI